MARGEICPRMWPLRPISQAVSVAGQWAWVHSATVESAAPNRRNQSIHRTRYVQAIQQALKRQYIMNAVTVGMQTVLFFVLPLAFVVYGTPASAPAPVPPVSSLTTSLNPGSAMDFGQIVSPDHGWDFRGCSDASPTVDFMGGALKAMAVYGALCSPDGMVFNSTTHGFVDIDDWFWGGTTSFEMYVRMDDLTTGFGPIDSRVFEFSDLGFKDKVNIQLDNRFGQTGTTVFLVSSEATAYNSSTYFGITVNDFFSPGTWIHVVATIEGSDGGAAASGKLYKDGQLVGERADMLLPNFLTRPYHYLGNSPLGGEEIPTGLFDGSIAFFNVWNG